MTKYLVIGDPIGHSRSPGMQNAAFEACGLGRPYGIRHVTPAELPERISALVQAFGLPSRIECSAAHYEAAVGLDKKGTGENITLILLDRAGHAVAHKMTKNQLFELL